MHTHTYTYIQIYIYTCKYTYIEKVKSVVMQANKGSGINWKHLIRVLIF